MSERAVYINWLITDLFLAIGLLFWPPALWGAIAATIIHNLYFMWRTPGVTGFQLQVRWVYLALLMAGQLPYCQWINWVQLFGTTALLTVDYCPLARILSLAPWNRTRPLSWNLVGMAIFTRPVSGCILDVTSPE